MHWVLSKALACHPLLLSSEWIPTLFIKKNLKTLSLSLTAALSVTSIISAPAQAQEEALRTPAAEVTASELHIDPDGADRFIIGYDEAQPDAGIASATAHKRASVFGSAAERLGTSGREQRQMHDGSSVVQLQRKLNAEEAAEFINAVQERPGVAFVEIDAWNEPFVIEPSDPKYPDMWHYKDNEQWGANVKEAWNLGYTGNGVNVAVIDSGITDHPDLKRNIIPDSGYDFVSRPEYSRDGDGRDANPADDGDWTAAGECNSRNAGYDSRWHGTHVAGIIGAEWNDDGVAGTAKDARIIPIRTMAKCGGLTSDIADGLAWAAGVEISGVPTNAHPADILNLSLGNNQPCGNVYQTAIDRANAKGARIFVSAGNSNQDTFLFEPASCEGVITVASTGPEGKKASYTNHGDEVDIAAPGGDQNYIDYSDFKAKKDEARGIWSTLNSGKTTPEEPTIASYDGTSMATPLVAGVAAMMLEANPELTTDEIRQALQSTAKDFNGEPPVYLGEGIIDAAAAIRKVMPADAGTPTQEPSTPATVTESEVVTETVTQTHTEVETTTSEVVVTETIPGEKVTVTQTSVAEPSSTTKTVTSTVPASPTTKIDKVTVTETPTPVTVVEEPVNETSTEVIEDSGVTETSTVTSTKYTTLPPEVIVETESESAKAPVTITTTPDAETPAPVTVTAEPSTVTLVPVTETLPQAPITRTSTVTQTADQPTREVPTVTETSDVTVTSTVTEVDVVDAEQNPVEAVTTTVTMRPIPSDSSSVGSSGEGVRDLLEGSSNSSRSGVFAILLGLLLTFLPIFPTVVALPEFKAIRELVPLSSLSSKL